VKPSTTGENMTYTEDEAKAATPHHDLIAELLNPNTPKTEREHAASREIERLQALATPVRNPDISFLKLSTQEAIKGWIADGTFVERAVGAMQAQELENMRLEKLVAAQTAVPLTDEQIETIRQQPQHHKGEFDYKFDERSFARAIEAAHGITAAPEQDQPEVFYGDRIILPKNPKDPLIVIKGGMNPDLRGQE